MSKRFSVHFNKSCKDFGALQIICNCTSHFCYGGFENFKKKASLVCFHWILHLSISFLFVELTYAAIRVLLFAFYFSIAFFVFSLQSQNAEQELQQAKTLMEDQARTIDEHKRRINKVFEKAEPLKVRIKDKWLMHQAWDSGRKWGVRGPCFTVLLHFGKTSYVHGASVLGMISVFKKYCCQLSSKPANPFPVNTADCLCNISGKIYFPCDICILLFRKSLIH